MTIGFLLMTMAEVLRRLTFIVRLHQIATGGAETEGVVMDLKGDHAVLNQGVGHLFHPGDRHTVGHLCPEVVDLELQVEIGAAIDLPKNVMAKDINKLMLWGGWLRQCPFMNSFHIAATLSQFNTFSRVHLQFSWFKPSLQGTMSPTLGLVMFCLLAM